MIIGSLRGIVVIKEEDEILIEVAGVGYRIQLSPLTLEGVSPLGEEMLIYVHHHIREDTQSFYGFLSRADCLFFEALISAHGVGPSLGLAILSTHGPKELSRIIANEDADALCLVPGIGKKTAARLIIELQSKLYLAAVITESDPSIERGQATTDSKDIREALVGLGYGNQEVHEVMKGLPSEGDVPDLLKLALQELATVST